MQPIKEINAFACDPAGVWLTRFPYTKVRIKELPAGIEGVVQAAYLALSNTVVCAPDKCESVFFSSVVHELYHAYQRHTLGIFRYLLLKTFCRKELETGAKAAELDAVTWYCERRHDHVFEDRS